MIALIPTRTASVSLRIALALCFIGHGAFGVMTKAAWVPYFGAVGIPVSWAWRLMPWIGRWDIAFGLASLLWPCRAFFTFALLWATWTALLRPMAGEGWWEFIERAGNYGVPIALMAMAGLGGGWLVRLQVSGNRFGDREYRRVAWVLRIAAASLLAGHAGYGLVAHKAILARQYAAVWPAAPAGLEAWTGAAEFVLAGLVLARPSAALLLFVCGWKFTAEMLYPLSGSSLWEVVERSGSYGVPLALALLLWRERGQTS